MATSAGPAAGTPHSPTRTTAREVQPRPGETRGHVTGLRDSGTTADMGNKNTAADSPPATGIPDHDQDTQHAHGQGQGPAPPYLLRSMTGVDRDRDRDRQRARSLSGVADLRDRDRDRSRSRADQHHEQGEEALPLAEAGPLGPLAQLGQLGQLGPLAQLAPSAVMSPSALSSALAISRVYAAHSLPSHIWSLNGSYFILNVLVSFLCCCLWRAFPLDFPSDGSRIRMYDVFGDSNNTCILSSRTTNFLYSIRFVLRKRTRCTSRNVYIYCVFPLNRIVVFPYVYCKHLFYRYLKMTNGSCELKNEIRDHERKNLEMFDDNVVLKLVSPMTFVFLVISSTFRVSEYLFIL